MLFSGEDALKPTSGLSGGECARLIFCKLMIQKPNFLVLDEPTNNLDLESNNALNIALQKYEGTVLLVTHDEDVLDEVATRVWHFQDGKIEDFKGTYEDFQSRTHKPVAELAKGRKKSHFGFRWLCHRFYILEFRAPTKHQPGSAILRLPD